MNRQRFEGEFKHYFLLITITLSVVLISCAEIAHPPGGEIDRNPPQLVSSLPTNGATDVAIDNVVTIEFSEPIVKPAKKKIVYISPRPQKDPKVKVKSNQIKIIFADSFQVDQTYIISLSGSIEDLRRNKLDTGTVIAFSTGATIDSGKISGTVLMKEKGQSGILVGLYTEESIVDQSALDSLYPLYVTETNSLGSFSFSYLPSMQYRLIAFSDKNRNERFNSKIEPYALTDRTIDLSTSLQFDDLLMSLLQQDTVKPQIISARFSADRIMKLRLSKQIDMTLLNQFPANLRLISLDNITTYPAKFLIGSDEAMASQIDCYFEGLNEGFYNLELTYQTDIDSLRYDSLEIIFAEDTRPPQIISFTPDSLPKYVSDIDIRIEFDEPINNLKLTEETFSVWDMSDNKLTLITTANNPTFYSFTCLGIKAGKQYRFELTEFDIFDMNDNPLGDSLTTYRFSTFDPDSLGSVSGKVIIVNDKLRHDPFLLTFEKVGSNQTQSLTVERSDFRLDLPAGKYLLKGFIDSNMNDKYDHGTLFPFTLAETKAVYSDTVQIRARFETTEVLFEIR